MAMRLDKAEFAIFDVETTGLYPYNGDRICEIAAIRTWPKSRRTKKFHTLINPGRPISPGAFSVNGITDEMVAGKPAIEEILPFFLKFIEGSVLVAYNAGFDLGFIEYALGSQRKTLDDYYVVDALRLARRLFPGLGRYGLGAVSQSLSIRSDVEHRAMADTLMTWKIFAEELRLLAKEGVKTVEDIAFAQKGRTKAPETVKDYKLTLIEEAIRQQKKLNITYRSLWYDSVTRRTITPKEIRSGYARSYVIAHCHMRGGERNFRLDCILDAKPCEEP